MGTKRNNNYTVRIKFNSPNNVVYLDQKATPYPQSKSHFDYISVASNEIVITAERVGKVNLEGVFKNYNSAIYRQITKSLIYYYCCVRKPHQIVEIKVERVSPSSSDSITIRNDELRQVVSQNSDISLLKKLDLNSLKVVFQESPKGHGYLYGLTYLIKSLQFENQHTRFDYAWKSFNAIYKAVSGETKDFNCHVFLRQHMENNPNCYPLIKNKVSDLSASTIRSNVRWVKFILNDFSTEEKTKAFSDFVLRNNDGRLLSIIKETLRVRTNFLKKKKLYKRTESHILKYLDNKNDMHLAATLCIKYAYFARNKIAHAETIESGFRLIPKNKEEKEIKWVADLLSLLIIDLVNCEREF